MRAAAKTPSRDKPSALIVGHDGVPIRRILAPLVRRLQQVCLSMITTALKEADLVQLEYALLVFVDDVPGISQHSLSEALGIDRNNVSLIADKLEARGLLKRAVNGADRRARELNITPEGRKLYRDHRVKVRHANDRILTSLTAEEKVIVSGHAGACGGRQSNPCAPRRRTAQARFRQIIPVSSEAWSCHVEHSSYLLPCLRRPSVASQRASCRSVAATHGQNHRAASGRRCHRSRRASVCGGAFPTVGTIRDRRKSPWR